MAGKDIEKTSRLAVLFTGGQPPLLVIVLSGGISKGPDLFARPFPAFSRPLNRDRRLTLRARAPALIEGLSLVQTGFQRWEALGLGDAFHSSQYFDLAQVSTASTEVSRARMVWHTGFPGLPGNRGMGRARPGAMAAPPMGITEMWFQDLLIVVEKISLPAFAPLVNGLHFFA